MVNLWFSWANVEAPVPGSVILACVYWKLRGFGLLPVFPLLLRFGFF
jgi:NADH:ubiquinone oxidoreductase subunit 4 (subunit M)